MDVSLLNSGGRLGFQHGGRIRIVDPGGTFEVDEDTARQLMASDPRITLATDSGPAVAAPSPASASPVLSTAFQPAEDLDALKVGELRERLTGAGLDSSGNKADLATRLGAYQAGYAAGRQAATEDALARAFGEPEIELTPSSPPISSSEAEPGPPPPEGGLTPENEAHVLGNPEGSESGAITLGDLGEGGKTK